MGETVEDLAEEYAGRAPRTRSGGARHAGGAGGREPEPEAAGEARRRLVAPTTWPLRVVSPICSPTSFQRTYVRGRAAFRLADASRPPSTCTSGASG